VAPCWYWHYATIFKLRLFKIAHPIYPATLDTGSAEDAAIEVGDASIHGICFLLNRLILMTPADCTARGIQSNGGVRRGDIQRIAYHDRARMKGSGIAEAGFANALQGFGVFACDALRGGKALPVISVVVGRPWSRRGMGRIRAAFAVGIAPALQHSRDADNCSQM
jgi:hypothetical protein